MTELSEKWTTAFPPLLHSIPSFAHWRGRRNVYHSKTVLSSEVKTASSIGPRLALYSSVSLRSHSSLYYVEQRDLTNTVLVTSFPTPDISSCALLCFPLPSGPSSDVLQNLSQELLHCLFCGFIQSSTWSEILVWILVPRDFLLFSVEPSFVEQSSFPKTSSSLLLWGSSSARILCLSPVLTQESLSVLFVGFG